MKRCVDMLGALVGLVLLCPVLALIWLAVVLESGLPGFFRQRRVGQGGKEFVLFKFRSMTTGGTDGRQGAGDRNQETVAQRIRDATNGEMVG